jgi:hypothetical protein
MIFRRWVSVAEYVVYRAKGGKGHFVDARFPTMAQARVYRARLMREWKAKGSGYAGYKIRKTKGNPGMKRLTKSTGWMSARRVKIVKRGRSMQVLVQKPPRRSAKKTKKKAKRRR